MKIELYGKKTVAQRGKSDTLYSNKTSLRKISIVRNIIVAQIFHPSHFSCVMPEDDPFMACLGCDPVDDYHIDSKHHKNIDRQAGEVFQATGQSRRVICGRDPDGNMRCRLRIDRAMQLRRVKYGRALQFIQSEQYLSDDDVELIRR